MGYQQLFVTKIGLWSLLSSAGTDMYSDLPRVAADEREKFYFFFLFYVFSKKIFFN